MADDLNPAPAPTPAPAPASPPPPPAAAPAPAKEPETFSREYVSELRNENKGLRLKATEQEQARRAADEAAVQARADADAAKTKAEQDAVAARQEAEAKANERIIRAELRTVAIKAGMVDLDGLKLADLSEVKLNEAGEVEGADALMTALKEAKPYLFGAPKGTSHPDTPPNPSPPSAKPVKEMTSEEYNAAKRVALKGAK